MWTWFIMPAHLPPLRAWYSAVRSASRLNAASTWAGEEVGARVVLRGQAPVPGGGVVHLVEVGERQDRIFDQLEIGLLLIGAQAGLDRLDLADQRAPVLDHAAELAAVQHRPHALAEREGVLVDQLGLAARGVGRRSP
jgi:hypothetical protein